MAENKQTNPIYMCPDSYMRLYFARFLPPGLDIRIGFFRDAQGRLTCIDRISPQGAPVERHPVPVA